MPVNCMPNNREIKMSHNKNKYHRRSIRLREYDYASPSWYYITICTHNRECLFGEVNDGKIVLSQIGKTAQEYWLEIPNHFANTELDEFVIMPNHIHGIIIINDNPSSNDRIVNDNRRDTACKCPYKSIRQTGSGFIINNHGFIQICGNQKNQWIAAHTGCKIVAIQVL